jgi:dTDP-4-dehydrorhamnose reductase
MRLLLTGASGQLGAYILRELTRQNQQASAWSGSGTGRLFGFELEPVDLANPDQVSTAFRRAQPDAVLHAGAVSMISDCYRDPQRAKQVNMEGTAILAELAAKAKARLLFVSTDLVFDGERGNYEEHDKPSPLSIYGKTKAAAEPMVLSAPRGMVVRASWLYGPKLVGQPAFFGQMVAALVERRPLALFEDEWRTPLALAAAARALLGILRSDFTGLLHLGGPERLSRLDMGRRLAAYMGIESRPITASQRSSNPAPEPRPRDTSLDSSLWRALFPRERWPTWEEGLREMGATTPV